MLNPERFFEARDERGDTIGFYYFEPKPPDLDYGLGLRPDLTGQGRGSNCSSRLAFAHESYRPEQVLLHVAAFNGDAGASTTAPAFASSPHTYAPSSASARCRS